LKILFDQGTPVPLRDFLSGHTVSTAYEVGWSTLKNGELLRAAEAEGFEVFVTTDSHLKDQQNLAERKMAIVVLLSTSWPRIQQRTARIASQISSVSQGQYVEIPI
jgi:predicted nuclease of predicted toxin-antitoxin system